MNVKTVIRFIINTDDTELTKCGEHFLLGLVSKICNQGFENFSTYPKFVNTKYNLINIGII